MTAHKDLKRIIRDRQSKTGESYTAARAHVVRERDVRCGLRAEHPPASDVEIADAIVLKVNRQSARVRLIGEQGQITFRSGDIWQVVPGHLVTLAIEKRWSWREAAYASGKIKNPRIDVEQLGLEPLPLHGGELEDLRAPYEPYRDPDPYAPLWRKLTAKPRAWFEMDPIAWGAFPDTDVDENLTCDASDLAQAGDREGARELLMTALCIDLRCIDAHGHLGNLEFGHAPERAIIHYQIGIQIAELSLPPDFDGVLVWGRIYNRPYLRCLHGYGLCLWRLGRLDEAERVFLRILSLNPNDNQGIRACWDDVRRRRSWKETFAR